MTVDLDTGAVSTVELEEVVNLLVGLGDRALAVSGSDGRAWRVLRSGLGPVVMDLPSSGELFNGGVYPADGETFWLVRSDPATGTPSTVERLAYDGSGVVDSFELRSDVFLRSVSPDGTVVAGSIAGGTFTIDRDGQAQRVSPGFPIAVNATRVLTAECSESFECGAVVRDLTTGELDLIAAAMAVDFTFGLAELAPDGTSIVFESFDDAGARRLIRLVDPVGECQLENDDFVGFTGLAGFAPDGSFVVQARPGSGGSTTIVTFTMTTTCERFELDVPFRRTGILGLAIIETAGLDE